MLGTILLIVLILLLIGALPSMRWNSGRSWGYYPSGGAGLLVVIVIILLLMRVI